MSSLHSHPVWVTLYQSSHAAVVLHLYIHSTYSTNVLLITVVIYHYCRSHLMTYLLIENSKMLTAWKHLTIFKWILRILTQLEIFKKSKEQNVLKRHSVVFFWFRITSSGKGLLPPPPFCSWNCWIKLDHEPCIKIASSVYHKERKNSQLIILEELFVHFLTMQYFFILVIS